MYVEFAMLCCAVEEKISIFSILCVLGGYAPGLTPQQGKLHLTSLLATGCMCVALQ